MKKFKPHTKKWFLNRVGKIVFKENKFSFFVTQLIPVKLNNPVHATACYNHHIDFKINYSDEAN